MMPTSKAGQQMAEEQMPSLILRRSGNSGEASVAGFTTC